MIYEKALEYAQKVVSGEEITTKEIVIQCQWFLNDLEKQNEEDFPYYFDREAIEKVEGILSLLMFATGLNVVGKSLLEGLVGFQCFFIINIFGWKWKSDSERSRYRDVILFIPRKNSKTMLASVVIIILLLTEQNFSEFYSICVDRELAGEVKKAISQILESSPKISKYFTVPKTLSGKIVCKLTNSFYQARTSEASRNNAIRPAGYIADECAVYKDNSNIAALRSGQLSVKNPISFQLTTAYAEDKSIFLDTLAYVRKMFNGSIDDTRTFAMIYYSEVEFLWEDRGILMANPLRIESNIEEIKDSRKKAIESPSQREEFLTKHLNHFLPSSSGEAFINIEDLRKCKIPEFSWQNRRAWVGIDLALSNDNCSYSLVTEEDLKIYADSYAFVPTLRIEEKSRFERIDYHEFIKEGKCFSCGDLTVDYSFIEDMIASIEERHGVIVEGIGFDRWNCLAVAQRLEKLGYRVVEVKQHSSTLFPPTKLLKEKILSQEFFYTENKLLEINFQNCKTVEDNNRSYYINKKKSASKVDMVSSMINAIYLMQMDVIFNPDHDWAIQVF